eukprot:137712_1
MSYVSFKYPPNVLNKVLLPWNIPKYTIPIDKFKVALGDQYETRLAKINKSKDEYFPSFYQVVTELNAPSPYEKETYENAGNRASIYTGQNLNDYLGFDNPTGARVVAMTGRISTKQEYVSNYNDGQFVVKKVDRRVKDHLKQESVQQNYLNEIVAWGGIMVAAPELLEIENAPQPIKDSTRLYIEKALAGKPVHEYFNSLVFPSTISRNLSGSDGENDEQANDKYNSMSWISHSVSSVVPLTGEQLVKLD